MSETEWNELLAHRTLAARNVHPLSCAEPDDGALIRGRRDGACEFRLDGQRFRVERARDDSGWIVFAGPKAMNTIEFATAYLGAGNHADAVKRLLGPMRLSDSDPARNPSPTPVAARKLAPQTDDSRPRLPPRAGFAERDVGLSYLESRGIPREVAQSAEKAGYLHIVRDGVMFISRDAAGDVRSVEVRKPDGEKRALAGSKKAYPAILPGNPDKILIVESGIDGLASHAIAHRRGSEPSTVICTNGAGNRECLRMPHVAQLIARASEVVVACDNERTPEIQADTDAFHAMQIDVVKELNPSANTMLWHPPTRFEDLADITEKQAQAQQTPKHEPEPTRGIGR